MTADEKHERLVHEYLHGLDIEVPQYIEHWREFLKPRHRVLFNLVYHYCLTECKN